MFQVPMTKQNCPKWLLVARVADGMETLKMGLRQVEQGFSSFFAKFLMPYFIIFLHLSSTSKNHQICPKKNEEKPCSTCLYYLFFSTR